MSRSEDQSIDREESEEDLLAQSDIEDESDGDFEVDGEAEKSETEEELERLVFGDNAGFRQGLKDFAGRSGEREELVHTDTGLQGLDDADLFITDLEPTEDVYQPAAAAEEEDVTLRSRHPPAWEDSDDERMMVSLASVPRLRKLRTTEAEDIVNGKEYSKRLRRQFELLNPTPEWARQAIQQPSRKKRRLSSPANSDDEPDSEELDLDSDLPSTAPLSKLLQTTTSLIRQPNTISGKKRKLRPQVLDIQRTKDISTIQPPP